jgi:glycosyltransferase involved in cell wall biosynthesis
MYSGALNVGYDFETVFRAASLLRSERVRFIIRGKGELSERLRKLVKGYGLTNLAVMTDILSKAELVSLLNSADVFLLPMSPSDVIDQGLPTKIFEYQALGKPIVCVSAGEAGRYIMETHSGLVTTTRKPEELAQLIMQLVNDDDLAEELGTNGFYNIKNNLTLEMVGKRLMSVINRSI